MAASSRIYKANGGGTLKDGNSANVPLIVEREPIAPLAQGVEAYSPEDDGTLRNRMGLEYEPYDYRVYALTVVSNGPNYQAIVQHVMQENAEQFSVRTGQVAPVAVDNSANLPYNSPANSAYGSLGPNLDGSY